MAAHCGTCRHTEPNPQDLTEVVCYGCPPQVVVIPQQTPQGLQMGITSMYPNLPKSNRACSLYEAAPLPEPANE